MLPNIGASTTSNCSISPGTSFITDAKVVQLVEELPNYLAIADGAAIETEKGKVQ